jgi:CHAT domain-containing protein/tetratricopeptide (TPR) repeat protein
MRRILAWTVSSIVLVGAIFVQPPAQAQQGESDQQQKAADLVRLWEQLPHLRDPAERIAGAERALKLEGELETWPLPLAREDARARLLWRLGLGYAERGKAEDLKAAIAAYERALETLTRDNAPDWAWLQTDLADAYWALGLTGDRAETIEKAIAGREAALTVINRQETPLRWAETQINLGLAYQARVRGEHADNLEKAIAAYEAGVAVVSKETNPRAWAVTHDSLGTAYRERMRGEPADNQDRAISHYEAALTVWTAEASPTEWASTQANLGFVYSSRIRGDGAENLEKAISAYEAALTVRTRETSPADWAWTQDSLATAYRNRVGGDHADNLEKAIAHYEAALTVRTREAFPTEWALTEANLAAVYADRIRGDRADNLEKAISAYETALTVNIRETLPQNWAWTQYNLGLAYADRLQGDRAQNVEQAIALYGMALTVRARDALPQDWAATQHSLGLAYARRVLGERADNLEKSIEHLEAALTVRSRAVNARDWADTQLKLGLAFGMRAKGERADNLERAIAASETALSVLTPETIPEDWAHAHSTLALFYSARIRGNRAENEEQSIAHLNLALQTLSRETFPYEWATAQIALGSAYKERLAGNPAENLDRAIEHLEAALTALTRDANPYGWALVKMQIGLTRSKQAGGDIQAAIAASEEALGVFTREQFPNEWGAVQGSLGTAYLDSTRGDRQAALPKAVTHLEAALSVQTRESSPREHLRLARALGAALSESGDWHRAASAYKEARETFLLLSAHGLDDTAAAALIGEAGPLFAEAAYAAAQRGENETALALASEGRARLMDAALKLQALDLPADRRRRLDEVRAGIHEAERGVEAMQGAERAAAVERLVGLRQELLGLVNEASAGGVAARGSALAEARALAGKAGAVAVPIVTRLGGKVLIVHGVTPRNSAQAKSKVKTKAGAAVSDSEGLTPIDMPGLTTDALKTFMYGTGSNDGWIFAYNVNLLPDDLLDEAWPTWMAGIDGLGPDLWRLIGSRLDAALKEAGVQRGARLVWLPTGGLGILPLGIAQDPASKRRLTDAYEIVYAPSLDALASAQGRIAKPAPVTLAAIVNPTGDLPAAEQEGRAVTSHFAAGARTVLEGAEATPEAVLAALKGRSYWHFASHGSFVWKDARKSALVMTGHQRLSVGRLLEAGDLGQPRLVVLSACETGLSDITSNPDEFIGLPGTFTALGAAGVLGSLWPVADTATALLIAKFYDLHMVGRLAPPTALRHAQLWLRSATIPSVLAYARGAVRLGRLDEAQVASIEEDLGTNGLRRARKAPPLVRATPPAATGAKEKASPGASGSSTHPYAHPYYWAGFIYTGL